MLIYMIFNEINHKVYIGKTTRSLQIRIKSHLSCKKSYPLYRAFKKYGIENFNWFEIDRCSTEDELNSKEIYYIALYGSNSSRLGYNLTIGGDGRKTSQNTKPKRFIGIPESIYEEIEKYATEQNLFMYQVVVKTWKNFYGIPEEIEKYAAENNLFMYQVVVKLWEDFKTNHELKQ